jgi:hypothetical protein
MYMMVVGGILGNIVVGAIVGATQWLALRNRIPNAKWLVLANALGWGAISIIDNIVGLIIFPSNLRGLGGIRLPGMAWQAGGFIGLFVIGAVTGFAQWLVFRRHFKRVGWWWILVTALGWAIGYSTSWGIFEATGIIGVGIDFYEYDEMLRMIGLVISGGVAGFAQWLLLRQEVPKAGWWIVGNLVGWIGSIAAILILGGDVSFGLVFGEFEYGRVAAILPYTVMPSDLLPGLLTGAVLVWLLRHPRPQTEGEAR